MITLAFNTLTLISFYICVWRFGR